MENTVEFVKKDIRKLILSTNKPLVIRNRIKSDLIQWDLNDWHNLLKEELLVFRCGSNKYTKDPQWEKTCSTRTTTFKKFMDHSASNNDEWWYFDYKYLREWFSDKLVLKENIDWSELGFQDVIVEDSTIWIGSKGAHTPCHIDTYGCNIVFQVYGKKLWLLFLPEENLKPSRIPYEESSIYSKLNFFSPIVSDFKGISHCHQVILNPGDVLVVPHKWWHYVENLETAISINAWLPLVDDKLEHIKESVTAILVGEIMKSQDDNCRQHILNPNMIEEMVDTTIALNIINKKITETKTTYKIPKLVESSKKEPADTERLEALYTFITEIKELSDSEFKTFIQQQSERFPIIEDMETSNKTSVPSDLIDFLEVITDEEVISLITKKLIDRKRTK